MKNKDKLPNREDLDQAFHYLHDQINRISVIEEVEMMKEDEGYKE